MAQRIRTASVPRTAVQPHPRNPRPVNDARVDAMVASYESDPTILERHPILVQDDGGMLTVVSGHHRLMMANRLRLPEVWVDIWQMNDEEAYFELVRANEQEPMDLLSYGLHFVHMPQKMLPGAYAKAIGRSATFVAAARRAAEVYDSLPGVLKVQVDGQVSGWTLAHVGRADPSAWESIVEEVLGNRLSPGQTEVLVNEYTGATKRPNAAAPTGDHVDDNPFLEVANSDVEPASQAEREAFRKEALAAAVERDAAEDEGMFKRGDTEAGRQPKKLKGDTGADPREVFGVVLHMFREVHDMVARINVNDLDLDQRETARALLRGLLDALG